jgi:hypothetical protein
MRFPPKLTPPSGEILNSVCEMSHLKNSASKIILAEMGRVLSSPRPIGLQDLTLCYAIIAPLTSRPTVFSDNSTTEATLL